MICLSDMDRGCFKNELPLKFQAEALPSRQAASAVQASERFLRAAAMLPEGAFIGWFADPEKDSAVAFSGQALDVGFEDLVWIFGNYAAPSSGSAGQLDRMLDRNRQLYALKTAADTPGDTALSVRETFGREDEQDDLPDTDAVRVALNMLSEAHALVRITADASAIPGRGHGSILISLDGKMTLRLRCALSVAFPHTAAVEVPDQTDNGNCLMDRQFLRCMAGFLYAMSDRAGLRKCPGDGSDFDLDDFDFDDFDPEDFNLDDDPDSFTTLDTLNLSARAHNNLMRDGIHCVEDLRKVIREDPDRIKKMGKKTFEEIGKVLASLPPAKEDDASGSDPMRELDGLIGLDNVKDRIRQIAAFARLKQDMSGKKVPMALNMAFLGSPGTAKTTVARITAKILCRIGLLKSADIVEAGRGDLVAHYVGQTAGKVKDLFDKARGRVLFIDEAYSLVDDRTGSFGDEAVTTIVQEMENRRDDTVVIFAGYPDRMKEFIEWNPGLRSRVPFIVDFSDYSADDLARICGLEAGKRGFTIGEDARGKLTDLCSAAAGMPVKGNGRFARNLVESAILRYASRHYGDDGLRSENDFILAAEDFELPADFKVAQKKPVGFQTGGFR